MYLFYYIINYCGLYDLEHQRNTTNDIMSDFAGHRNGGIVGGLLLTGISTFLDNHYITMRIVMTMTMYLFLVQN